MVTIFVLKNLSALDTIYSGTGHYLQWNLSFGTPPFKGHKICSWKKCLHNLCIFYLY